MKLTLTKKILEAKNTISLYFKCEKKIDWLPGQYFYYTLPTLNYPDPKGSTRQFTIASSPTEDTMILTTKLREDSGFKKTLNEIQIGQTVEGDGPSGTFILDQEKHMPQVFLAGGIGITPFRSFIKYAIDKAYKTPIFLLYSNSTPEEITYKNELDPWAKTNPNFKIIYTISKPEESKIKWTGNVGRIDSKTILEASTNFGFDIKNTTFWVCGPPPMVTTMEQILWKLKISTDNIVSEKFTGY